MVRGLTGRLLRRERLCANRIAETRKERKPSPSDCGRLEGFLFEGSGYRDRFTEGFLFAPERQSTLLLGIIYRVYSLYYKY